MHAVTYEIRVDGVLSDDERAEFEQMQVIEGPRQTLLVGTIPDQAALHGVLGRLESLGLRLVEVRQRPPTVPREQP